MTVLELVCSGVERKLTVVQAVAHVGQRVIRIVGPRPAIEGADNFPAELAGIFVADAPRIVGQPAVAPRSLVPEVECDFTVENEPIRRLRLSAKPQAEIAIVTNPSDVGSGTAPSDVPLPAESGWRTNPKFVRHSARSSSPTVPSYVASPSLNSAPVRPKF